MNGQNTVTSRIVLQALVIIALGIERLSVPYKRQIIFQHRGIESTIRCVDYGHCHYEHTVSSCRCRQIGNPGRGLREDNSIPFERRVERAHHTVGKSHHIVYLRQVDGHHTVAACRIRDGLRIDSRYCIGCTIILPRKIVLQHGGVQ